jgi:hypothetical protein
VSFSDKDGPSLPEKLGFVKAMSTSRIPSSRTTRLFNKKWIWFSHIRPKSLFFGAGRLLVCLALLAVLLVCGAEANTRAGES